MNRRITDRISDIEQKARRVRSTAGVHRYNKPLGSLIDDVEHPEPEVRMSPNRPASRPLQLQPEVGIPSNGIVQEELTFTAEAGEKMHIEIDDGFGIMVGMDDRSLEVLFGIKTGKCRYCDKPATKQSKFNEGRGAINTCDSHTAMAKHAIKTQGYELDGVETLGESKRGGVDTDPDPSPNPGATRLREYWVHGEGAAKIKWGSHGDFEKCVRHLRKYVGTRAEGLCNVFHRSALGAPPGQGHGKSEVVGSVLDRITGIELKKKTEDEGDTDTVVDRSSGKPVVRDARTGKEVGPGGKKPAAKKSPAKKAPAKKEPQNNNNEFNSKHPRGAGGKFTFKDDPGTGAAERGMKDKNAAPDGKVHGRIGRAQANLVSLGMLDPKAGDKGNAVDGKLGANTERAIMAFQKNNKMKPTGKLDKETEAAINRAMLKKKGAKKAPAKKATSKKSLIATKSFAYDYEKRAYSQNARDAMAESGDAMPDGSFPIKNEADLQNAIQSVGRAKDIEAAKRHIMKRAKDLGCEDMVPEAWRGGDKSFYGVSSTDEIKDGSTGGAGMEYKGVTVSGVKEIGGENSGLVEAIVSVTGIVDNVKDIIDPGIYAKSLAVRTPKGVWHHNWQEPVSRTEGVKELLPGDPELPETLPDGRPWPKEAGALKVLTRFNLETQRGREAYADVKFFGTQQEWSIGYNVPVGGADIDPKTGIRTIKAIELFEYSPVLFGAMPVARTASIKSAQQAFAGLRSTLSREELLVETKELLNSIGVDGVRIVEGEEEKAGKPVQKDEEDPDAELEEGEEEDQGLDEEPMDGDEEEDEEDTPKGKTGTKAMPLSAAQLDLVKGAIDALQKLYDSMGSAPSEDTAEEKMKGRKKRSGAGCKSLEDLVSDIFDDSSVISAAKAFDVAIEAADVETASEAADNILDAIEDAIDNGEDLDVTPATDYIAESLRKLSPDEEMDEEDPADDGTEEEDDTSTGEKVTMSVAEFKSLLGVEIPGML